MGKVLTGILAVLLGFITGAAIVEISEAPQGACFTEYAEECDAR